jgi:biotin synthase
MFHKDAPLEKCALLSVKTGNCSEDCAYCPQSKRYKTEVDPHPLLEKNTVLQAAKKARESKSTYFCLATAGREVQSEKDFELLLEMIHEIAYSGLKVCTCLGFLNEEKAKKLKQAGVFSYNHNIDSGPNYYKKIITTHRFEERLETIEQIKKAGMKLCTGGILGMGESLEDRIDFLFYLARIQPDSIPLNVLVPALGTPLEKSDPIPFLDLLRIIAILRIILPKATLRLAGGRSRFSHAEQLLAFTAGIGGVHIGEKLLVLPNCSLKEDEKLFALLENEHH